MYISQGEYLTPNLNILRHVMFIFQAFFHENKCIVNFYLYIHHKRQRQYTSTFFLLLNSVSLCKFLIVIHYIRHSFYFNFVTLSIVVQLQTTVLSNTTRKAYNFKLIIQKFGLQNMQGLLLVSHELKYRYILLPFFK